MENRSNHETKYRRALHDAVFWEEEECIEFFRQYVRENNIREGSRDYKVCSTMTAVRCMQICNGCDLVAQSRKKIFNRLKRAGSN
jgi:hypothetical protein